MIIALLLTGCSARQTSETISDVYAEETLTAMYEVQLSLPDDAVSPSMEANDGSRMYLCDGYTLTVQRTEAGDLDKTLREISGFSKEELTVMKTSRNDMTCYETVWSAAGEGEDQICRSVILDDGKYHYCVTAMANYSLAGDLSPTWQQILDSVNLVSID